jgi:hypothetical protein
MATPAEQAAAFKTEGNKAFAAHDWNKAIEFYSKAIKLDNTEATYWANRAAVCTPRCFLQVLTPLADRVTDWMSLCTGVYQNRGVRICY